MDAGSIPAASTNKKHDYSHGMQPGRVVTLDPKGEGYPDEVCCIMALKNRLAPAGNNLFLRIFLPLLAPALAILAVFMVIVFFFLVPLIESQYRGQKYDLCQRLVESAISNLESRQTEVQDRERSLRDAQERAVKRLRSARFGDEGKDYYWIIGPDGRFLMHPYRPDLEGLDTDTVVGPDGAVLSVLVESMNVAVGEGEDGFIEYRWHWKDNLERLQDKVSYVERFEPWGWIIGTGVYIDDMESDLAVIRRRLIMGGLVMTALASGMALLLSIRTMRLQKSESEAAMRLASSEENLRITLQSIGDAVIATDTDGRIRQMNSVAENLTGWRFSEVVGRSLKEVFTILDEVTGAPLPSPVDQVLATGEVVTLATNTLLLTREGAKLRIADSGAPIRDRSGAVAGVVLVFRDVTEEFALQEQLRQVQKMEVVGQLAGGVAHDFNNMLAAIMGNAELMDMDMPADSGFRPQLAMIINGAKRAAELTQKLLTFSRKGTVMSSPLDIHNPIREAIALLQRSIDRNIRIEKRFGATAEQVVGDPTLLQNAFLNLGINARDAMPEGGTLTFTTRNLILEGVTGRELPADVLPGRYIEVTVMDTGLGMTTEVLEKVFEPFYTTKPVGRGTGLGLATVYGTVREHGGTIRVDSRPGQGTTVRMLLPQDHRASTPQKVEDTSVVRGHGCVMVVDDEDLVRSMAKAQLKSLGYEVILAKDGVEALEMYARLKDKVDLVLLDVVMPRLGGRDTLKRLRMMNPEVRVILSSGFDPEGALEDLDGLGATGFIAKPYRQAQLSQAVAGAMQT